MQRGIALPLLAFLCLSQIAFASDEGLVAYYTFEEGPGEIVKDWSGRGNDGKNLGAEFVDLGDDRGYALRFQAENAHVDCGNPPDLDLTSAMTIDFWLYRETVIQKGEAGLVGKTIDTFTLAEDGRCWFYVGGGPNHSYILNVPLKEWCHVAATFDGKKITTYLDGKLQNAFDSKVPAAKQGGNFYLRYPVVYGDKVDPPFKCMMDNVRVYNRALSAEEIAAHYRAEAQGKKEDVDRFQKVRLTPFPFPGSSALVVQADFVRMEAVPAGSTLRLELREPGKSRALAQYETHDLPASRIVYWTANIAGLPSGEYDLRATLASDGVVVGVPSSLRVELATDRPAWSMAYDGAKILNNFVAELLSVPGPPKDSDKTYSFVNPRDGWVYISSTASVTGTDKVSISLDPIDPVIVHTKDSAPTLEAMRWLAAGPYTLRVRSQGETRPTNLVVRSIPEIIHAGLGYDPCPWFTEYGPYDWDYLRRVGVLDNVNVILERTPHPENASHLDDWRKAGKRVMFYYNLTPLMPKNPLSPDDVLAAWRAQRGLSAPGYQGIFIDEFASSITPDQYAAYSEAVRRIKADPAFKNRSLYPYCIPMYVHQARTAFLRALLDAGYKWAEELYLNEQPTEAAAFDFMNENLKGKMLRYQKALPDCARSLIANIGNFSTPAESSDLYPEVNYKVYLDMQMSMIANDPVFFGLYGLEWYHPAYADEEIMRWSVRLLRHYCIEGKRDRLSSDPYVLPHLVNGDFVQGGQAWTVSPAEPGSISIRRAPGYGWLQGRWQTAGPGDIVLVTRRSSKAPNVITQPIRSLTPGRAYSLRLFVMDFTDFTVGASQPKTHPFAVKIEGVKILPEQSFRALVSSGGHEHAPFNRQNPLNMTYSRVVFRAEKPDAMLTLSDWENESSPDGPEGQQLAFNYLCVDPYLEEDHN
ncbi:MAG: LamG domain-containing protein [Planctomycetota bacterium]